MFKPCFLYVRQASQTQTHERASQLYSKTEKLLAGRILQFRSPLCQKCVKKSANSSNFQVGKRAAGRIRQVMGPQTASLTCLCKGRGWVKVVSRMVKFLVGIFTINGYTKDRMRLMQKNRIWPKILHIFCASSLFKHGNHKGMPDVRL